VRWRVSVCGVASVWMCACVRGQRGGYAQALLSARDLALSKASVCRVSKVALGKASVLVFFSLFETLQRAGGAVKGFAECPRSDTRQTLALPSARSGALGNLIFFIFLLLLFHNVFSSICSDVLWKYLVKYTQQYIFDFSRNIIPLFYAATAQI